MSSIQPVLLGLAAPSAANAAGSLLERTLESVAEPFAMMLDAAAQVLAGEEDATAESTDAASYLDQLQMQLAGEIEKSLSAAGVELTEPLTLRISPTDGSLEVVGDHPQRALIESALADEPDLAAQLAELLALRQAFDAKDDENDGRVLFGEPDSLSAIFSSDESGATLSFA
jgi:transposase